MRSDYSTVQHNEITYSCSQKDGTGFVLPGARGAGLLVGVKCFFGCRGSVGSSIYTGGSVRLALGTLPAWAILGGGDLDGACN